jgi:hypothetical protein
MTESGVVYGLLDTSASIGNAAVAARCRDLTITWSRYDYHGPMLEAAGVDGILQQAAAQPARFCFIQSYGRIIRERWIPGASGQATFLAALRDWMAERHTLVAGRPLLGHDGWYGLDPGCLLVDLDRYRDSGCPGFGDPVEDPRQLPVPVVRREGEEVIALEPGVGSVTATPLLPGWGFVDASVRQGLTVPALPDFVRRAVLDLAPDAPPTRRALERLFSHGITPVEDPADAKLAPDQAAFVSSVRDQVANARRGVFLLNIESYQDVDTPPGEFQGPVSTLYSVASGFKPNRILQTHGMDEHTRIVFFDYSERALAVRRALVEQWDGEDLPRFIRHLFASFPPPDTFYQLWAGCTPDTMDWPAVEAAWRSDLDRMGGAEAFKEHWGRYRLLPHAFVHCDLLADPSPLWPHVRDDVGTVMWFSNAPFTVYGNWHAPLDERKARYERLIDDLARRSPGMILYGSDYANANVNCLAAGDYAALYREQDRGPLGASPRCQHVIRM